MHLESNKHLSLNVYLKLMPDNQALNFEPKYLG